jgi:hypothetical protein
MSVLPRSPSLHAKASAARAFSAAAEVPTRNLRAIADNGEVLLEGKNGVRVGTTNWAFNQVSRLAGAPAGYLGDLPAELAADCLNHGLASVDSTDKASLFLDSSAVQTGGLWKLRAVTSDRYERLFNSEITERLCELEARGPFQPAPAAFDGSRGLYMGDRDLFCFMVDNNRRIFEKQEGGLSRGFFVWNSEVGARSFGVMTFLYEYVCGNHRVWGAKEIKELRVKHVGSATRNVFRDLHLRLTQYAESSGSEDEAKIQAARDYVISGDRNEIIDTLMGLRDPALSKRLLGQALDKAAEREDWYGNPKSLWGIAGGLTEIARDLPNADERTAVDRASAKVIEMAFA